MSAGKPLGAEHAPRPFRRRAALVVTRVEPLLVAAGCNGPVGKMGANGTVVLDQGVTQKLGEFVDDVRSLFTVASFFWKPQLCLLVIAGLDEAVNRR